MKSWNSRLRALALGGAAGLALMAGMGASPAAAQVACPYGYYWAFGYGCVPSGYYDMYGPGYNYPAPVYDTFGLAFGFGGRGGYRGGGGGRGGGGRHH
jgi:hypothetical protein